MFQDICVIFASEYDDAIISMNGNRINKMSRKALETAPQMAKAGYDKKPGMIKGIGRNTRNG